MSLSEHVSVVYSFLAQSGGLPWWLSGKESTCQYRRHMRQGFNPWVGKIPWRRKWQPIPVFLLGKSYGPRSPAGYSPQGHKRVRHDLVTKQEPPPLSTSLYKYTTFCLSIYQLMDFFKVVSKFYCCG